MTHSFDTELAAKYGVEESILLWHLIFWIRKNMSSGIHNNEGRTWTWGSAVELTRHFPYWCPRKITRLIESLTEQRVILVGEFNQDKRQRRSWYALMDEALADLPPATEPEQCIDQKQSVHLPKTVSAFTENGKSLHNVLKEDKVQEDREKVAGATSLVLPEALNTDAFKAAWESWQADRRERRKPLTKLATSTQLSKLERWGEAKAIQAIQNSIANGWQGLFEPSNDHETNQGAGRKYITPNRNTATLNNPDGVDWDALAEKSCTRDSNAG